MRECATFADIVSDNNFWKGITGQRKDDVDTENPDNVGLYMLQIMKASEREEQFESSLIGLTSNTSQGFGNQMKQHRLLL